MSKKKTHEQYVAEIAAINPNIEVVGKYVNSHTKIIHKCVDDGYEWLLSPANALSGKGCPVCGGTMRKTHEQYVRELKIKNPYLIAVGRYINNNTKITHRCLRHNYEWEASPSSILQGSGCHVCRNEKMRNRFLKSNDEYVYDLATINKDVIALEKYVNARTPIKHRCLIDGWEWHVSPDALLRGHGCPQCNKCNKSFGEKAIASWLDSKNILYKPQETFCDCKDKYVLRFDFYLTDYNILIEYNGIQHYKPVDFFGGQEGYEGTIKRDGIKENYCKYNDITLVTIPYYANLYEELEKMYELFIIKEVVA